MSIVTVQAWHCDVCGYEWLKTDKAPIRCSNPKCRSRNWNVLANVPALIPKAENLRIAPHSKVNCKVYGCLLCKESKKR